MSKIIDKVKVFGTGLFLGMRDADKMVSTSSPADHEINQTKESERQVFSDLLQEKVTNEVIELRDKYYRVLTEADNYKVKITGGFIKGSDEIPEGTLITTDTIKRTDRFDNINVELLQTHNYKITVVQDHKTYENDSQIRAQEMALGREIHDVNSEIFKIERDFIPRFQIEFLINKLVVKENKNGKCLVDLYFSKYARQFVKTDSVFLTELNKLYNNKEYKSELFDFDTIGFITDKCFGVENLHEFKFKNKGLKFIKEFDGNFVAELNVEKITDIGAADKFKTEDLDKKYKERAPKKEMIDINTILRNSKKNESSN